MKCHLKQIDSPGLSNYYLQIPNYLHCEMTEIKFNFIPPRMKNVVKYQGRFFCSWRCLFKSKLQRLIDYRRR